MIHGFKVDQIVKSFDAKIISEVVSHVKHQSYYDYHSELKNAAGEIKTAGDVLLTVLSEACSMMLTLDGAVFTPLIRLGNGARSSSLEDFKDEVAEVLLGIYELLRDPILKSRVGDVLWMNRKSHKAERPLRFAECALDGYLAIGIDAQGWYAGRGEAVWSRAVSLAKSIGKNGEKYVAAIEKKLMAAFQACPTEGKSLLIPLARVILKSGLDIGHPDIIISRLETRLQGLKDVKDIFEANDYFDLLIQWHQKIGNMVAVSKFTFEKGEANRRAGDQWFAEDVDPGVLSTRYEEALRCYDKLPSSFKKTCSVGVIIRGVRKSLHVSYRKMSENMRLFRGKQIDISRYISKARKSMHGLEISTALCRFVGLHKVDVESLRTQARNILRENPLLGHFCLETFDGDQLVARMNGISIADSDVENTKRFCWMMLQQYQYQLEFEWKACLWPSFNVIIEEHRLNEKDFLALVKLSHFVPENRQLIFARGLNAGFRQEFQTAAMVLIPQIENAIRVLLKAHGGDTYARDKGKELDSEVGLSGLIKREDFNLLFDESLGFEVRALFGEAPYFDLRNRYAHGRVDDCSGCAMLDFMVWHLALKLVILGSMDHPDQLGLKLPVDATLGSSGPALNTQSEGLNNSKE